MANKKVRMIGQISGTRDGKDWPAPGGEITLPDDEANALIANGLAVDPSARAVQENALADVLGVEAAVNHDTNTAKAQQALRTQIKPAPHADEPDAYHNPPVAGEQAAAEAGQAKVDEANKDLAPDVKPEPKTTARKATGK
jgi:hypothetical protein